MNGNSNVLAVIGVGILIFLALLFWQGIDQPDGKVCMDPMFDRPAVGNPSFCDNQ